MSFTNYLIIFEPSADFQILESFFTCCIENELRWFLIGLSDGELFLKYINPVLFLTPRIELCWCSSETLRQTWKI